MSDASQVSYQLFMNNAYPGQVADLTKSTRIDSYLNDSGLPIDFGLGVVRSITDYDARLPNAPSDLFLGVTIRDLARENTTYASTTYLFSEVMNVLRAGRIYVVCEVSVSYGDPVFCRFIATGSQQLGAFRNNDDDGTAFEIVGASFDVVTSSDPVPCIVFSDAITLPPPPPTLNFLIDNNLNNILDSGFNPIYITS